MSKALTKTPLPGKSFFLFVVAPVVASAVYFGGTASDVFLTESRFVVRSSEQPTAPNLGGLLKGLSPSVGSENAMVVRDYLLARESIASIDKDLKLREHYKKGDMFQSFPAWFEDASLEQFYDYFPKMPTAGKMHKPERDTLENMNPACPPCNIDKHSLSLEEWRKMIQRSNDVLMRDVSAFRRAVRYGLVSLKDEPVLFYFEKLALEKQRELPRHAVA